MKYLNIVISLFLAQLTWAQGDSLLQDAKNLIQKDQLTQAIEVLHQCPDHNCQYLLADVYYKSGEFVNAKPILDALLEEESLKLSAHRLLSKIYETEGNVPKAIKHYTALLKADPENAVYHRKLGQLYGKSGYTLESLKYYNKAKELNPRDIITLSSLSELYFALGQTEQSDSIIQEAIAIDSNNINAQLINSKIAYKLKDYDRVTKQLRFVKGRIDLDEYFNKIYGFSLVKMDSFNRAIFTLNQVILNSPDSESAHYYLGLAYEGLEEPKEAKFHYSRALENGISKQTSLYHKKLAQMAEDEKDWPVAIKHFKKALDYKTEASLYFRLALATDNYYKDKSTCVRYYTKYLNTAHQNLEWKKYALERKNYLKEIAFLKKN